MKFDSGNDGGGSQLSTQVVSLLMQNCYLVQRISQLPLHFFYHFPHINEVPICYSQSHTHLQIEPDICHITTSKFLYTSVMLLIIEASPKKIPTKFINKLPNQLHKQIKLFINFLSLAAMFLSVFLALKKLQLTQQFTVEH